MKYDYMNLLKPQQLNTVSMFLSVLVYFPLSMSILLSPFIPPTQKYKFQFSIQIHCMGQSIHFFGISTPHVHILLCFSCIDNLQTFHSPSNTTSREAIPFRILKFNRNEVNFSQKKWNKNGKTICLCGFSSAIIQTSATVC